ncbi:RDD family protein [Alteribacillus bidgolensis]|uniref:RDD family protein n=1 Tax=Alteribacillus bidgolensis TaxID=930129 RepID=A0A1G8H9S7_9BACI|nr:RDD family protein [Alteribacillus bidgolensis]SDI03387.1 RDD family protein [Alteribacillus bidgolensis]
MNASLMHRFKAFMIDYVFIFAYLGLLLVINVFFFPSMQMWFSGSLITAQFAGFFMVTLPVSLYFIISDSKIGGQSLGKRKMGLRVVDKNGEGLSLRLGFFRTLLKFLPWELSHFFVYRIISAGDGEISFTFYVMGGMVYILIFVYIWSAVVTRKKQSL